MESTVDCLPITDFKDDKAVKLFCCLGVFVLSLVWVDEIFVVGEFGRQDRWCHDKNIGDVDRRY